MKTQPAGRRYLSACGATQLLAELHKLYINKRNEGRETRIQRPCLHGGLGPFSDPTRHIIVVRQFHGHVSRNRCHKAKKRM